jgi:hypothetical protein
MVANNRIYGATPWVTGTAYVVGQTAWSVGALQAYRCILDHTANAASEPGVGVDTATYWTNAATRGITMSPPGEGSLIVGNSINGFTEGVRVSVTADGTSTQDAVDVCSNYIRSCNTALNVRSPANDALTRITVSENSFFDCATAINPTVAATNFFTAEGNRFQNCTVNFGFTANTSPRNMVIRGDRFRVTTTTATPSVVRQRDLPDEGAALVRVRVTAMKSDGSDRAYYERAALFYRDGGGNTVVQGSATPVDIESNAAWDVTLDAASTDYRVTVTGAAATTIVWNIEVSIDGVNA